MDNPETNTRMYGTVSAYMADGRRQLPHCWNASSQVCKGGVQHDPCGNELKLETPL